MIDQTAHFAGDIPAHYDRCLGPHLFVDYAADMARRTAAGRPRRVLEIAAGTGIVTRALRDALPDSTNIVASDLNAPMLEVARQKFSGGENVEFRPADALALPFGDGSFDAMVCQFGFMFFPDKDKACREAFRVLAPGGRYHFSVWDSVACNPSAEVLQRAMAGFFRQDAPTFFNVPYGYYRIDPIKAALASAGFDDIRMHVVRLEKTITEARMLAEGFICGTPVIEEIRARGTDPAAVIAALTVAFQAEFGPDPGCTTLQALIFDARKP